MSAWLGELADRLDVIRYIAYNKQVLTARKRKDTYDNKAVERTFEKGDLVLARTPLLLGKLEEAWTGPRTVVKKSGPVMYKLTHVQGKGRGKVVHLNTIKEYNERHQRVGQLTLLMEDKESERLAVEPEKKVVGQGTCEGFSQNYVNKILQELVIY